MPWEHKSNQVYVGVKELEVESITHSPDKGAGEGAKQPGDKEIFPAVDSLAMSLGQQKLKGSLAREDKVLYYDESDLNVEQEGGGSDKEPGRVAEVVQEWDQRSQKRQGLPQPYAVLSQNLHTIT